MELGSFLLGTCFLTTSTGLFVAAGEGPGLTGGGRVQARAFTPRSRHRTFRDGQPHLIQSVDSAHPAVSWWGLCPSKTRPPAKVQVVPWPGCEICKGSWELDLPINWGLEKPVGYWSPVEMWEGFGQRCPDCVYGFTPQTEGHTDLTVSHTCNGAEETRLPCGAASA